MNTFYDHYDDPEAADMLDRALFVPEPLVNGRDWSPQNIIAGLLMLLVVSAPLFILLAPLGVDACVTEYELPRDTRIEAWLRELPTPPEPEEIVQQEPEPMVEEPPEPQEQDASDESSYFTSSSTVYNRANAPVIDLPTIDDAVRETESQEKFYAYINPEQTLPDHIPDLPPNVLPGQDIYRGPNTTTSTFGGNRPSDEDQIVGNRQDSIGTDTDEWYYRLDSEFLDIIDSDLRACTIDLFKKRVTDTVFTASGMSLRISDGDDDQKKIYVSHNGRIDTLMIDYSKAKNLDNVHFWRPVSKLRSMDEVCDMLLELTRGLCEMLNDGGCLTKLGSKG